jgi:hypothetical protein
MRTELRDAGTDADEIIVAAGGDILSDETQSAILGPSPGTT